MTIGNAQCYVNEKSIAEQSVVRCGIRNKSILMLSGELFPFQDGREKAVSIVQMGESPEIAMGIDKFGGDRFR